MGRAVESLEEAVDHLPGDELDAAELRERGRIEQVEAGAGYGGVVVGHPEAGNCPGRWECPRRFAAGVPVMGRDSTNL